jgi:citrate synthase
MVPERDWLTASEAVARLGVKPQTLYAYVSRGLIRREAVPGTRRSRYRRDDVERLALGARPTGRLGRLDLVVDTALTQLDPDGTLTYRGWSVADAARTSSFETVAEWLWTGERRDGVTWSAPDDALAVGGAVAGVLPAGARRSERLRVAIEAAATVDPLRYDRRPSAVAERGRRIICVGVDAMTPGEAPSHTGTSIAARAWPRLGPLPATPARVRALDAALVLLADHELATSAFATRVAASTWADPYAAVSAGLAALSGPLHGGASETVRDVLRRARGGTPVPEIVGDHLRDANGFPGFGHAVYRVPDPRAGVLLELVRGSDAPVDLLDAADGLLAVAGDAGVGAVNVDFALAVFAEAYELPQSDIVFALARCAGLVAHAIEEYEHRLRFRPRAAYVGPLTIEQ